LRVTLFDPAPARGASWAAAGMLAPVTEAHYGEEEVLALNLESASLYPAFVAELQDDTGMDVGYRDTGTLIVARDADDAAELHRLHDFQRRLGLDVESLDSAGCRELVPGLSPRVGGGIFVAGDHQIDNRALLEALAAACRDLGVVQVHDRVVDVTMSGPRATGVTLASGAAIAGCCVVLSAGAGSASIELPPEMRLDLRPVKGQLLHLRGDVPFAPCTVRGLDVYLVPRADGRLVVGATMEELGLDMRRTAEAAFLLLRDAYELVPGVLDLELVEHTVGLRPATPDNAPLIGPSSVEGLVMATGHFRNGVLLAPVTADRIVAHVTSEVGTPA